MYGLITKLTTVPLRRESVIDRLVAGRPPPVGCLSHVVARDPTDGDVLWVTEVWTDAEAHRAALQRPDIKAGVADALAWVATIHDPIITEPVGGVGLPQRASSAETVASTAPSTT